MTMFLLQYWKCSDFILKDFLKILILLKLNCCHCCFCLGIATLLVTKWKQNVLQNGNFYPVWLLTVLHFYFLHMQWSWLTCSRQDYTRASYQHTQGLTMIGLWYSNCAHLELLFGYGHGHCILKQVGSHGHEQKILLGLLFVSDPHIQVWVPTNGKQTQKVVNMQGRQHGIKGSGTDSTPNWLHVEARQSKLMEFA